MMETQKNLPVIIIGAGPVGLAAAAHLSLRHQPFLLFEGGPTVASHILSWAHTRLFSPWRYNLDQAARRLLEQTNWQSPEAEEWPTGRELYDQYLLPLSQLTQIKPFVQLNSWVTSVGRQNLDKAKTTDRTSLPFVVQVQHGERAVQQYKARAVIDASGTWGSPNSLGSGSIAALGENENLEHLFYGIPDILGKERARYQNKSVLVVGGGHSAINVILDLARLKEAFPTTQIHWVMRKKRIEALYGGQERDALPARGALGSRVKELIMTNQVHVYAPFYIEEIRKSIGQLTLFGYHSGEKRIIAGIDAIISNTGSRPDFSFLREVRLGIDSALESASALANLIDPTVHSCGTVLPHGELELRHPEQDFYMVGSKSYGRAPNFLMATGYEQVRSIVAALAGEWEAARRVTLELPETGVCSLGEEVSCCVTPPYKTACCLPSQSLEENNGTRCTQPASGAACCEK